MAGTEMPGCDPGISHFIITRCIETNGIGACGLPAHFTQYPGNRRTVGSAAEKRSGLVIANGGPHTGMQNFQKLLLEFLKRASFIFPKPHLPVFFGPDAALTVDEI